MGYKVSYYKVYYHKVYYFTKLAIIKCPIPSVGTARPRRGGPVGWPTTAPALAAASFVLTCYYIYICSIYIYIHTHIVYIYIYIYISRDVFRCLWLWLWLWRRLWLRPRLLLVFLFESKMPNHVEIESIEPRPTLIKVRMFGRRYLSKATWLIRPRLLYIFVVVSRITMICYMIRHVRRKRVL